MKINPLPPLEVLEELLSYDPKTGELRWQVSRGGVLQGAIAGRVDHTNRRIIGIASKVYVAHRIAWKLHYKKEPVDLVDHINGDPGDNRIDNLREATHSQNRVNSKAHADSNLKAKGITWCKTHVRFVCSVTFEKRTFTKGFGVGNYGSKEAAFEAAKKWVQNKRQELHGEFARGV